jgi:hypothetical protein
MSKIGFDNLNPIIWYKIANASYEVSNGSKFLGKPYEPNAIIKNDIEFILMQRKPGGYRSPSEKQRDLSRIDKEDFSKWFQQFWTISGASPREHPAPFPLELAYRLVRMFSFSGATVVDRSLNGNHSGRRHEMWTEQHRSGNRTEICPDDRQAVTTGKRGHVYRGKYRVFVCPEKNDRRNRLCPGGNGSLYPSEEKVQTEKRG